MRRAANSRGIKIPSDSVTVSCTYNGGRSPCFTRRKSHAHPECICFKCAICDIEYTAADVHEPIEIGDDEFIGCHHQANVRRSKNPARYLGDYNIVQEISDVESLINEMDAL